MTSTNNLSIGFKVSQYKKNQRLQVITLSQKTVKHLLKQLINITFSQSNTNPFLGFLLQIVSIRQQTTLSVIIY